MEVPANLTLRFTVAGASVFSAGTGVRSADRMGVAWRNAEGAGVAGWRIAEVLVNTDSSLPNFTDCGVGAPKIEEEGVGVGEGSAKDIF
jgi:hypothetical protein